jgi:hypothetical protein
MLAQDHLFLSQTSSTKFDPFYMGTKAGDRSGVLPTPFVAQRGFQRAPQFVGCGCLAMTKMWNWLKKEFRGILPVWLFFVCAFALIEFTLSSMLRRYHIQLANPHEYLIAALIMAKVVLTVDSLLKTGRFTRKPLIYPTLWNTSLYFIAAVFFHHLEHVFSLTRREHLPVGQAIQETVQTLVEPNYWATMAWLIALIFFFCASRELSRSLGPRRLKELFFGGRSNARIRSTPPSAA